ncbi:unnamed protein product [Brassica rapa subsp. trilocularis]
MMKMGVVLLCRRWLVMIILVGLRMKCRALRRHILTIGIVILGFIKSAKDLCLCLSFSKTQQRLKRKDSHYLVHVLSQGKYTLESSSSYFIG